MIRKGCEIWGFIKRDLSQKCLYPARFVYKLTRNPITGVCHQRDQLKSTAANGDKRVKQTMLRYFKCITIFRDKHYPNRSFVTLFAFVTLIAQFLQNDMFSIEMDPRM